MSENVKNFIGIAIGSAIIVVTFWALIFGTWALLNNLDDGPREDAKQALYKNCEKQFRVGVFGSSCVEILNP